MAYLIFILGYALCAWLTAFWIGTSDPMNQSGEIDEFEMLMIILWPLCAMYMLVFGIGRFFAWLWSFVPGKPKVEKTLGKMSLIFKPCVLGVRYREWKRTKEYERRKQEAESKQT